MPHSQGQPTFKKEDLKTTVQHRNALGRGTRNPNLVTSYKGHVNKCEVVKHKDQVEAQRQHELDVCAGYPMVFGLPKDSIMGAAENAAHVRYITSHRPEAQREMEKYALTAGKPQPKESDFRRNDPNRQVLDLTTGRPLIETVLSDDNNRMPKRTKGMKSFPQAYQNSEVNAGDIPRAARHEMESMPASYKTNLVRTLCMLYPKFTAESRLARQKAAHTSAIVPDTSYSGAGNKQKSTRAHQTQSQLSSSSQHQQQQAPQHQHYIHTESAIHPTQCLSHSASCAGVAHQASQQATAEVQSRPNNVRIVSLMRAASAHCP